MLIFLLGTVGSHVILATHAFPLPGHFRKVSYWELSQSSFDNPMALYEKKEHAFADNFVKLHTKQGPPNPSHTPCPCSTNVAKEHLSFFDLRMCRTSS